MVRTKQTTATTKARTSSSPKVKPVSTTVVPYLALSWRRCLVVGEQVGTFTTQAGTQAGMSQAPKETPLTTLPEVILCCLGTIFCSFTFPSIGLRSLVLSCVLLSCHVMSCLVLSRLVWSSLVFAWPVFSYRHVLS